MVAVSLPSDAQPVWNVYIFLSVGLACKGLAVSFACEAKRLTVERSWYEMDKSKLVRSPIDLIIVALNGAGTLSAVLGLGPFSAYLQPLLALALLLCAVAEVWGRWRFYGCYVRVGL